MPLFEQLKGFPKVDMHINLSSSISPNLAYFLTNEASIQEIEDKMIQKNITNYYDCLTLPISFLKTKKNIELAINDLIDRLISNNVIYSELFLDLPLYNSRLDEEKILNIILNTIKIREYSMQVVLCLSDKKDRDSNIATLNLFDKYYLNGVNGIYFYKDKMTNVENYHYIFDRLIKNNMPYILLVDSKLTNNNKDIYSHAKRLIYTLKERDEEILNMVRDKEIMLEFSITSFMESSIIADLKTSFINELYLDNYLLTFTSRDMTILNTDILNEYCLLFNNWSITIHDIIKIVGNDLINIVITESEREKLLKVFKEKCNMIL